MRLGEGRDGIGFMREHCLVISIIFEERRAVSNYRLGHGFIHAAARDRGGTRIRAVPGMAVGEIGGKVSDEGIERLGTKQLEGKLPLLSPDETWVSNDLERSRLERII